MDVNKIESLAETGILIATAGVLLYTAVLFVHATIGNPIKERKKLKIIKKMQETMDTYVNQKKEKEAE